MKNLKWNISIIIIVISISIIYIIPTFCTNFWPKKKINLGLDLKGGTHLILKIDTNEVIKNNIHQLDREIRSVIRKEKINILSIETINNLYLSIILDNKQETKHLNNLLNNKFHDIDTKINDQNDNFSEITLKLSKSKIDHIEKLTLEQGIETIRNRIDQFGVSEPDIRAYGKQQILVQLPGTHDIEKAKKLIGRTAMLEFKFVNQTPSSIKNSQNIPNSINIETMYLKNSNTTNSHPTPVIVEKQTLLSGAHLIDAKVGIDQNNNPSVKISLNKQGAKLFEQITAENINKHIAIILDGVIYSIAIIREKIPNGQAEITGQFNMEEAQNLCIALRAGALPAPIEIIEERTIGPSLGADSIKDGLISICVGGTAVALFMLFFYKSSGLIVNFALFINILLIAASLAGFQATLTLPGIAGIILTIGMAVDSNVLIFERIKEELKLGNTFISSVRSGYNKATLTILDANITTLIAALVLFKFGTGPIKGFAITLSLGILSSLFSSLILTRTIFDYLLINRKIKKISI